MKFTRLRLLGFKSFVEPTDIPIEPGLTGVVGPNGCGKSNLVEALRWVMGESSHKAMRAADMDDVIFSGSGNRPGRNMAEVTMSIDNVDRTAPSAFNDQETLEVTRRIERDSGSTYRINHREVRARDVQTTRDGLTFTVEADGQGEAQLQVPLLGRHNVMNLLAATGAALALGMTLPEIAVAARRVEPVEHRLQPIQGAGGVLVIDDTYNSNPKGAAEALSVLGELPGNQKVLVTPGMIELAEREAEETARACESLRGQLAECQDNLIRVRAAKRRIWLMRAFREVR